MESSVKHRLVRKPRFVRLAVLASGLAVAALYGSGLAQADTHIWFGGNTDCTSQGYMSAGSNPGDNNIPVVYGTCDGSFAPFVGSTRADVAIQEGVDAGRVLWDANCSHGERCVMHGFSIGAAPVTLLGTEVGADAPGSNTHVVTDGNAWGRPGVFGGQPGIVGIGINIGAPVLGVPTLIDQVPNSENRFIVNDGWANNSGQAPWAEITELACLNDCGPVPQHSVPQGEPVAVFHTNDGVTQKVYGEPLFGVIPPQNNPMVNPELLPPAPKVVLTAPSFFGEAPCIAPDGGQYFTPGDAPC